MRFLTDPHFKVSIDNRQVEFSHIPEANIRDFFVSADGAGIVQIRFIDAGDTDRTTQQHGVAWHVNGRLVGQCSWKGSGHEQLIDGRRIAAKRYTFIVMADCLGSSEAVLPDWSGFDRQNPVFTRVYEAVNARIREILLDLSKQSRDETFRIVKNESMSELTQMSLTSVALWKEFVYRAQEECPSIGERDLVSLGAVLAKLEASQTQYSLIRRLSELEPNQLDDLHDILKDWTLDMAKMVLDELRWRLKLLDNLRQKVFDAKTQEVQELQPLFRRGLWIFGPEFETIEFTSNEGMTKVIQKLFSSTLTGSRERPDFAIVPDGSVGFYSYPYYDQSQGGSGGECGVARLVIVELKKPGVTVGTSQKNQCWRYVKELYERGLLNEYSRVTCFALGEAVDPLENAPREEMDGRVRIVPLDYSVVIERAKSRLLKLYDRVKAAPFLDGDGLAQFLENERELEVDRQLALQMG